MENEIKDIKQWLGTGAINIFGVQFSGKDTVGEKLAEMLDAIFIGSGDIVRAAREQAKSDAIRNAANVTNSGVLMPIDEYKELIVSHLLDEKLGGHSLVLNSVGRWIGEEKSVLDALQKGNHAMRAVLLIEIPDEEIWHRWQIARDSRNGGRVDDMSEEKVARRIREFREKTQPVIDIYRSMGLIIEINGLQSRDAVFAEVVDGIHEFFSRVKTS